VAAVAAVDEDTAREALALIDVDYEELPAVFDLDAALAPGAPLVHDGVAGNVATVVRRGAGDVERGWREADLVIERRYSTHAVRPLLSRAPPGRGEL
jgi:CO/xanthine dehydrogenase Mo-binding subunit